MHPSSFLPLLALTVVLACAAGCTAPSSPPVTSLAVSSAVSPAATAVQAVSPASTAAVTPLVLHVGTLEPGASLPVINTCTGAGESPEVSWSNIPAGTKSLVLILDDPDAPGGTFTHWIVYNIPPTDGSIARAQQNQKILDNGANAGENSGGSRGYYPPCPPVGTTHRYIFRLYAVDMVVTMPTASRDAIGQALVGHTLENVEFVTRFGR
jgi:Raf kinase inhibitor-like YbhB/YbcL family protein